MPFVKYTPDIKLICVRRTLIGERLQDINELLFLNVTQPTLDRWVALYTQTQCVIADPRWYQPNGRPRDLSIEERWFVAEMIEADPTLYVDEIATRLSISRGYPVASSVLQREIRDQLQLTLKVALTVDPAQDAAERARFLFEMRDVPVESIVAIDESHINGAKLNRPRARALRGHRTKRLPRPTRSHRHTMIAGMSIGGVVAVKVVYNRVTRDTIEDYFENHLLPLCNRYPGPNSLILLDNASIHLGGDLADLCALFGVRLQYLPRYSPDYNPIEKGFSVIKSRFRRDRSLDWSHGHNRDQVAEIIYLTAIAVLTDKMAQGLFRGSIYL